MAWKFLLCKRVIKRDSVNQIMLKKTRGGANEKSMLWCKTLVKSVIDRHINL